MFWIGLGIGCVLGAVCILVIAICKSQKEEL